ncbi:hypothetical protein SESBI_34232 [Sesbania bispinosa]|nr:hypothetical protein SESBI_34232 [Sesbania bispinosa]
MQQEGPQPEEPTTAEQDPEPVVAQQSNLNINDELLEQIRYLSGFAADFTAGEGPSGVATDFATGDDFVAGEEGIGADFHDEEFDTDLDRVMGGD